MRKDNNFNADNFLKRNIEFWQDLEVHCVAECCGIDAFDFSKENLDKTIEYYDSKGIIRNLEELIFDLELTKLKYTSSSIFNQSLKTNEFLIQIKKIKKNIEK